MAETYVDRLRVFLCHASEDKPAVRMLRQKLGSWGHAPWLDEEQILPGQDWEREIRRAMAEAHIVLACISSRSEKKGFVQKELRRALDIADEQPEGAIFIIPVKLEPCSVPERLKKWQWVDLFSEGGESKLRAALQAAARATHKSDESPPGPSMQSHVLAQKLGPPPVSQEQLKPKTSIDKSASISAVPELLTSADTIDLERPFELELAHNNLGSQNPRDRKVAAKLFGKFAGEESVEGLFKLLDDPDEAVVKEAREVLLRPDYVKNLIEADIGFVKTACEQRDKGAISELEFLRLLPVSNTKEIFGYAKRGIRLEDPEARSFAASLLGRLGEPAAVEFLRGLLEDPEEAVTKAAKTALIRLVDEQTIDQVINGGDYGALYDALTDPSSQLVNLLCDKLADSYEHIEPIIAQAREAGSVGKFVDTLLSRLDQNDEQVRRTAIFLLRGIGDARAVDRLISLLVDTSLSAELHKQVISALGYFVDGRAVTPLLDELKRLEDEGERLRDNFRMRRKDDLSWKSSESRGELEETIVWALGLIGDARAVDPLLNYMKRARQLDQVVISLGNIKDPRAIDAIAGVVRNGDARFLKSMVNALVKIGGPRAVDALIEHLEAGRGATPGERAFINGIIVEGLGRMRDPRSVEALASLLKNQDDWLRAVTIEALAQIGGERTIDALVAHLKAAEAEEKTAVAKALGALGDERGVTALKAQLQADDERVRLAALEAIQQIGNPGAVESQTP